jgi:hypothetical protein
MKDCKCGGRVENSDSNGPICSNSGKFVHACTAGQTEIRAQITLSEPDLDEITAGLEPKPAPVIDRYSSKEDVLDATLDEHDYDSPSVDGRELSAAEKWQRKKIRFQRLKALEEDFSDLR